MKVAKLICVSADNNNKFYEMQELADGTFSITFGRVGSDGQHATPMPMSQWDKQIKSKIKKGYTDVSHLMNETSLSFSQISNAEIANFVETLQKYCAHAVLENYSVKAAGVSEAMILDAQSLLDQMSALYNANSDIKGFNETIYKLLTIIPRKIKNTRDMSFVSFSGDEKEKIESFLKKEQDNLDSMAMEVSLRPKVAGKDVDILKSLGLEIEIVTDTELKMIKSKMNGREKDLIRAFKVVNHKTQKAFEENMQKIRANNENDRTELWWHGSRASNWLSILKTGLLTNPNAPISGKMFGHGIYFADKFQKSLNYCGTTSSVWVKGGRGLAYLALFDVHVGNQYKVFHGESSLSLANLKKRGNFHSTWGAKGQSLYNDEFIVYQDCQCTVCYIIEMND